MTTPTSVFDLSTPELVRVRRRELALIMDALRADIGMEREARAVLIRRRDAILKALTALEER